MAKLVAKEIDSDYNKIIKRTAKAKGCFLKPNGDFERIKRQKTNGETITFEKVEAFCGASTDVLEKFIHKKYGKNFGEAEVGLYVADDAKNSESFNPFQKAVKHEWFRLPDGTIIDGSAGQFKEDQKALGKDDRLRIIPPDDPRQKWYNPDKKICELCGGRLIGGKCPSPDVDKIMKLINTGLTVEEAKEKIAKECLQNGINQTTRESNICKIQ